MKSLFCCLSILGLALVAIAGPTAANGTTPQEIGGGTPPRDDSRGDESRRDRDAVRLAQARGSKDKPAKKADAAKTNAARREANARKAAERKADMNQAAANKAKRGQPISREMEAEVTRFVREHHRELLALLSKLKVSLPQEYERAVRELSRQQARLEQLEGRDRYAAELELWKAQSRVRLLSAKVRMGDDEVLRAALKEQLANVYDLRAKLVQRDRDRAAERLQRLDEQLQTLQSDRDKNLEKQLLSLTHDAHKRTKAIKTSARNSEPTPGSKTPVKTTSKKTID